MHARAITEHARAVPYALCDARVRTVRAVRYATGVRRYYHVSIALIPYPSQVHVRMYIDADIHMNMLR